MPRRSINRLSPRLVHGVLLSAAMALAGCKGQPAQVADPVEKAQPELAVMTSLPILWAEGDIGSMLSGDNAGNWVKDRLEQRYRLVPVDRLTQLSGRSRLLLAQPRALSGEENVALDDWVREGGDVLLLADPMLTAHSDYALGDARAPQPVALLSPILARWGMELTFDPAQSPEMRVSQGDLALPVRMTGGLRLTGQGHQSTCTLSENALIARCDIGEGRVTVVADAALVEDVDHALNGGPQALDRLLDTAFADASGQS